LVLTFLADEEGSGPEINRLVLLPERSIQGVDKCGKAKLLFVGLDCLKLLQRDSNQASLDFSFFGAVESFIVFHAGSYATKAQWVSIEGRKKIKLRLRADRIWRGQSTLSTFSYPLR
jgi:hypothetical protein